MRFIICLFNYFLKIKVGFFRKLFAGGFGGAVGCLVGNPFDIVKIRLINDILGKKYKGMIDCLNQMLQKESLLGNKQNFLNFDSKLTIA